jgi:hypothetical protein
MMGKEKKEGKWFCMGTWKSSGAGAPLDALISSAHQISPSKARSSDYRAELRYFQGGVTKKLSEFAKISGDKLLFTALPSCFKGNKHNGR